MPVTSTGIGHSHATIDKEIGLGFLLQQHFCITKEVLRNHAWATKKYFYIDAYAGSGYNPEEGIEGSPIVFRNNSHMLGVPFRAIFIDETPANIEALLRYGFDPNKYKLVRADNSELVPALTKAIATKYGKDKTYGLLYCDPNTIPDPVILKSTSENLPKMDILIRMNVTAGKRGSTRVEDVLHDSGKNNWVIRGPEKGDRHQMSFLFGTNYKNFKAWKSKGFHMLDSTEGKALFNKLNYTAKEQKSMSLTLPISSTIIENYNLF